MEPSLTLKPGSNSVEATLALAGPKPLALEELEEALKNGISAKRVTQLVKQFLAIGKLFLSDTPQRRGCQQHIVFTRPLSTLR